MNVIARSGPTGVDLELNSDGAVIGNINVSHSNYATTGMTGAGASALTHIIGDATDQSTPPAFVNAAAGDFHQVAGSPTIDAGVNDPANGANDPDGDPRTLNGKTDIGAFEFVPAGPPLPNTKITKASIKATEHEATFSFEAIGLATGFQCALVKVKSPQPSPSFSTCRSARTYKHLKSGRYIFEVRALNSAGSDPTPATRKFKI